MEKPPLQKLFAPLAPILARALWDTVVQWIRENPEDVEKAADFVIDKITKATPWKWDEKLLDGLAARIPGVDGLGQVVTQLQQLLKNPLGGLFGGGR